MKRVISSVTALVFALALLVSSSFTAFAAPNTHPNTHANTGDQRYDIVQVAKTQLGYTEGSNNDTKYGNWYGLPNQPWCAMFVSWCARQANIPTSVLKNSSCAGHSSSYFNIPYYDGSNYTPKPGDLFFTKSWSHVGLVYYVEGNYFYTIEGNSNSNGSADGYCVCTNKRYIPNFYFGVPNYGGSGSNQPSQPSVNTYTIKSSSGAKVRTGAGTSYSNVGGLAKGSVVYYDQTSSANGYTWYHITRVDAKSGSWGSYVGNWVAAV